MLSTASWWSKTVEARGSCLESWATSIERRSAVGLGFFTSRVGKTER